MSSKKKNKNRQYKPPNLTPPQKEEVGEPLSPSDVINTEIESVVEERVPNIVSENITAEVREIEETPKKPKRNRGKKKKEDDKTDKEDEVKFEEPIADSEVQPVKYTLDEANIAPTARKKKNKNKKGQGPVQEAKKEEPKIDQDAQFVDTSGQPQEESVVQKEESGQDMKSAKKKNKKKNNRNDSERSDKAEEVSCTSVFQKLLAEDVKVETIAQPTTDDSSFSEVTVKEVEIGPQAEILPDAKVKELLQNDEVNKNKKKNKKAKTQTVNQDVPINEQQVKSSELTAVNYIDMPTNISEVSSKIILKETPETHEVPIPSSSTADDNSLKLKAKIAKPVDKKKGSTNLDKADSKPKPAIVEDVKVTEIQYAQEAAASEILPTDDLDDVILVPLTEITPDWHEKVKIEEGNGPVIGCEDNNETTNLEQPIHNDEKNTRKISPKPERPIEMAGSSHMPKVVFMPEEMLPEASSSSKEKLELKYDEKMEIKPEEKMVHQENKIKHIKVSKGNEKRDKRKKSPKPSKLNEQSGTPTDPVLLETSGKSSEHQETSLEEKKDDTVKMKPEAAPLEDENAQIQIADNEKRKNKKKSPKPKIETAMSSQSNVAQTELSYIAAKMSPVATSSTDIVKTKSEEITEIKIKPVVEKTESKKGEMGHIQTPDSEKRQKRKKSPKPVDLNLASSSKSTQKSDQNTLKIEDIIIIQAEVVSDENAKKGKVFIAREDSTDKNDSYETEVKHDSEKSKKRKKSPRPAERECTQETKDHSERYCTLETQGEVQMPVTPMPQDIKLIPEVRAVELETPKVDPIPSPNEVTPDFIEYPRCSSEQLDNNNNMVIQEISHADQQLEVPIDIPETPFIQSTHLNSPELFKVESKNDEKTDLKSKVMEVNKDMEDLRTSIERSLAELSFLEKTDRDAEKKLEEQKIKNLGNTKNSEVKQEICPTEQPDSDQGINPAIENKESPYSDETVKSSQGPVCPVRKDPKGKGKSKKKGKQESTIQNTTSQPPVTTGDTEISTQPQDRHKEANKSEQSSQAQGKEKQQKSERKETKDNDLSVNESYGKNNQPGFEPIENFEDAMTSSADDVNKTFEMIVNEANPRLAGSQNNPEINVIAPQEEEKGRRQEKQNPVSPPKNLLGHPDIPVPSSRTDYKKEKNKPPNYRQAKVKIKDANQVKIETSEKTKESTESKKKIINFNKPDESICVTNQNDEYVYKYSFRKVFLQCSCHVCKKDLNQTRVPCSYCNLIFYCSQKHKDEDYSQHQALCFAVSTIIHLKDQKFIYADSRNVIGHNYRLLRMQMIVSCEKVLKRKLTAWEQEALLYPRMCADPSCREWRQGKLMDCEGCGQISYCSEQLEHLPKSHSRWCKSYNLYRGLVKHQQTKGRLEPKLPTRVVDLSPLPDNINEVLAAMYEEKIEMSDIEYAALTQLATAPLTALFCLQFKPNTSNGLTKKSSLILHIVGAELQFEADVLNKWEVFLLHLTPHVEEMRVVLVGPDLNPSNLPLELLGKIKHCDDCRRNKRRVVFDFQDKRNYHEFWASEDFTTPDLVCAFNPSIQRSSAYNGKDTWPATINCIFKLKTPLAITSYTLSELTSDLLRIQECATVGYNVVCAPRNNSFSSVRPDRNFISDDEAPLLFKNHCVTVVCGV